jgi:hypothetical protein
MSTFNEFRRQFIRGNIREILGDGAIGVFISQSAETSSAFPAGKVFIAGISVPYLSGSGNFGSSLKDTNTIYLEYTVTSSIDQSGGGKFPYTNASGSLPASSSVYPYLPGETNFTYASGSKGYSVRTIEIPVREVQARDSGYFFDPKYRIEIPVLLAKFEQLSYVPMRVSFSGPENFYKDDYNAIIGNYTEGRKSRKSITVDRSTVSPRTGAYTGTTLPGNYPVILKYIETQNLYHSGSGSAGSLGTPDTPIDGYYSSSLRSFENVESALFAPIQDSSYSSKAWRNLRYDGVVETNLNILGNEPALSFQEFEGAIYPNDASGSAVKAILNADRKIVPVYYANFNKANELRGKNPGGTSTLPTFTHGTVQVVTSPTVKRFTILYEEQDSSGRLIPISSKKIYSTSKGAVYATDEDGKVSGVE